MLKEQALHYYEQGYNCAESLVYGTNAALKLNLDENACHLMAGLGGGLQVGDVCGALTGSVCALGCLIVKTKAHDCPELKPLTQAVVEQVRTRLGSLRCDEIKPRLFQPERRCAATVENCADILEAVLMEAGILTKNGQNPDQTTDQL